MKLTNFLISCALVLSFSASVYAGELLTDEGIDYYNKGVRLQMTNDFVQAIDAYKKCLLLTPDFPGSKKFISNNMGVIYAKTGKSALAKSSFMRALRMDSSYKPAHLNLALLYYMEEKVPLAMEHYMKATDAKVFQKGKYILVRNDNFDLFEKGLFVLQGEIKNSK